MEQVSNPPVYRMRSQEELNELFPIIGVDVCEGLTTYGARLNPLPSAPFEPDVKVRLDLHCDPSVGLRPFLNFVADLREAGVGGGQAVAVFAH